MASPPDTSLHFSLVAACKHELIKVPQ